MSEKEENPIVEVVKTLASAAILAVGIRACVAEARFIPSESMLPTLEIDDRLIIEKSSYPWNDYSEVRGFLWRRKRYSISTRH